MSEASANLIDGRVGLVTGSASGIGACLVKRLTSGGWRLVAADLRENTLPEKSDRLIPVVLDVRDPEGWDRAIAIAIERFGRLDVLFNVAGIVHPGYVHEIDVDKMRWHLEVNTLGVMLGTRAAAAHMVKVKSGHIVNVASLAGLAALPGLACYCASKFAVRGYSNAASLELRPHGVHVTCVCPDAVRTPMLDLQKDFKEAAISFGSTRFLSADDVVDVIVGPVLRKMPMEALIPKARGLLARLSCVMPWLGAWLLPGIIAQGRKRQAEYVILADP